VEISKYEKQAKREEEREREGEKTW